MRGKYDELRARQCEVEDQLRTLKEQSALIEEPLA